MQLLIEYHHEDMKPRRQLNLNDLTPQDEDYNRWEPEDRTKTDLLDHAMQRREQVIRNHSNFWRRGL